MLPLKYVLVRELCTNAVESCSDFTGVSTYRTGLGAGVATWRGLRDTTRHDSLRDNNQLSVQQSVIGRPTSRLCAASDCVSTDVVLHDVLGNLRRLKTIPTFLRNSSHGCGPVTVNIAFNRGSIMDMLVLVFWAERLRIAFGR